MKTWVQDWVQVARLSRALLTRKLRRLNESVEGYEPGGRTFESCRAHQDFQILSTASRSDPSSTSVYTSSIVSTLSDPCLPKES